MTHSIQIKDSRFTCGVCGTPVLALICRTYDPNDRRIFFSCHGETEDADVPLQLLLRTPSGWPVPFSASALKAVPLEFAGLL